MRAIVGIHKIQRSATWERPAPRRIGEESRAAPAPLPVPRIWPPLAAGLGTALLGLAGLCWQGREQARADQPGTWLTVPLDGLAAVLIGGGTAGGLSPGRRLGFLILAVVCFAAWKAARKAVLAYRPGPVDVHEFLDATPGGNAPVHDLKSQFCQRLSETHIYPPYAGPADPPPANFLDVAGTVDARTSHPVAMVLQMLPRIWPRIGYRVTGVLQRRAREPGFGVSVTVTSFLRGGRCATTTVWGGTWDEAIDRAAYWVLATILPVTRLGRVAPWRNWCARELPAELFAAYDRGKRSQDGQHLDEALRYYGEALRLDPFNVDLRMMVASVQEELGLHLDALDTYQSALVLREPGGWYDARLWTTRAQRLRHPVRHLAGTLGYLRRRPESHRLRYRYACALAYTDQLVRQWFRRDAHGEREAVRRQIRQRLESAFVARYWPAALPLAGPAVGREPATAEAAAKEWLRWALRASPAATTVVFQLAAAQELYRLREDALLAWLVPAARTEIVRSELTRSVLLLLRDVWVPLRLGKAWHEWAPAHPVRPFTHGGALAGWWRRGPRRRAEAVMRRWPCPTPVLVEAIRCAQRANRRRLGCVDFYHAACSYAFALQGHLVPAAPARRTPTPGDPPARVRLRAGATPPPGGDHRSEVTALVGRAVEQLRAALACTENGTAADRLRRSILSGNPDLGPLRRLPDFCHFEEVVYPTLRPVLPRSGQVIDSRLAAYAGELVARGALLLAGTWHQRTGPAATGDAYQLIRWLDRDIALWRTLDRLAHDHARYWRDRAEFIQLVREVVDPARLAGAGFPPEIPRYDDVPGTGTASLNRRLESLHRAVTGPAADGSGRTRRRLAELDLRGTPLRGDEAAQICARQAGRWQRVAERMRQDPTKVGEPGYTKVARRRPMAAVPARRAPAL